MLLFFHSCIVFESIWNQVTFLYPTYLVCVFTALLGRTHVWHRLTSTRVPQQDANFMCEALENNRNADMERVVEE